MNRNSPSNRTRAGSSRRRKRRNRSAQSEPSGSNTGWMPPVSVPSARPTQGFSFGGASNQGRSVMRVSGRMALYNVGAESGLTDGLFNSSLTPVLNDVLVPTSNSYLTNSLDLLSSAFARYRFTRLVFEYEPGCSTSTVDRLCFAFSDDPVHPTISTSGVGFGYLVGMPEAVTFAAWQRWNLRAPTSPEWKYTYEWSQSIAGNVRDSASGCFACFNNNALSSGSVMYGTLYLNYTIELMDFSVVTVSEPTLRVAQEEESSDSKRRSLRAPSFSSRPSRPTSSAIIPEVSLTVKTGDEHPGASSPRNQTQQTQSLEYDLSQLPPSLRSQLTSRPGEAMRPK